MALLVVASAAWGIFRDCHMPVANGLGYDGATYGQIALEPESIFQLPFNRVQRCLPSLLVHVAMTALRLQPTPDTVIALFSALNLSFVLASFLVWLRIVAELKLGRAAAVFGFCGLFLSFALATMPYYYPVLTDTAAVFLGVLSVWFFLRGWSWALLGIAAVSGLVWPTLMYFLAPLILFPAARSEARAVRRPWHMPVSGVAALVAVLGALWALPTRDWGHPMERALPLTLALLAAYVYWGTLALLEVSGGTLGLALESARRCAGVRAIAIGALYVGHYVFLRSVFATPTEYWQTPRGLAVFMLKTTVIAPAGEVVGHAAYLGVLFLVVVRLWPRICREAASLGPGALLFLTVSFAFSVNAESRHSNALWPMVVVLVSRVLDGFDWSWRPLVVFFALSALNSRVWVNLNVGFPELYFANWIVNMTPFWYSVQALGFLGIITYLEISWRRAGILRRREAT